MAESAHKKLERIRAPRVNITYDVEVGGAIEMKELPFIMGVLGDFSGHSQDATKRLKDQSFVEVNPDNFDDVLARMNPSLNLSVANKLSEDPDAKIGLELDFKSLDDFSPENVAQQVPALKKLLELRRELGDLRGKIQGNEALEEMLQASLSDAERLDRLKSELDAEEESDGEG